VQPPDASSPLEPPDSPSGAPSDSPASLAPPDDESYALLRHLTSPVVAITCSADGWCNGLIVNSAQRASLVPAVQRVSMYISKTNFSHGLIYRSGLFGMHLLRDDQWSIIWRLGLVSGRDGPKLTDDDVITGTTGCPLLADALAAFECRVVNAMDAGAATFFLGEVVSVRRGQPGGVMTSEHFRAHMPDDKRAVYEANMAAAQDALAERARHVDPAPWPGTVVGP
jgi:flavin reductase (DIM6/NTAB) family NADH-FMN oxidoreductase RutF